MLAHVRRTLTGGLELDDDPGRVDVDEVHRFLASESYWARGRSREAVERLVREADRVMGLYDGARQVGFARAVSDGVAVAYLADVYVLQATAAVAWASSSSARWWGTVPSRGAGGCSTPATRTACTGGSASALPRGA